jgi:hypothetical protein
LTARAIDRALGAARSAGGLLPIALAASVVPMSAVLNAYRGVSERSNDRQVLAQIFHETGRPGSEFFFAGRPGDNRACGRLELVYDDWLYPVFESIHLAEPRSNWLTRALVAGPVRFVVNTSESPEIDGLGRSLVELGFARRIHLGPFFVWERILSPRGAIRRLDGATSGEAAP